MKNTERMNYSIILEQADIDLRDGADAYRKGDYEKAFALYQKAAQADRLLAWSNLGYCYYYGHGTAVDKMKAKECWEIAAKREDICALYKLGDMYRNGDLPVDLAKSKEYYTASYRIATYNRDLDCWPDICLRVAKYCRDEMTHGDYLDHLNEAKYHFGIRLSQGDPTAEKPYRETCRLLDAYERNHRK